MTGLKSGSGDDLWGDESEEEEGEDAATAETSTEEESTVEDTSTSSGVSRSEREDETGTGGRSPASSGGSTSETQPYIVRRAIQDKSVQFERDERLTFFVHDDVVDGERELISEMESTLGRDVPKFDVREAVYRAALQNQDDVLNELIEMGYSPSTE
jgi:hypothetical protein